MIMVLPTMYRATQNPDTPNLPFAQSLSPTMFRDNQNPNEPNLPFAQRPNPKDNTTCYEIFGTEMQLTEAAVQYYRNVGQTLKPCSSTPTPTPTGNNTEIWKHIDKLYAIHGEQESRLTDAYKHRLQIEKLKGVDYGVDIKKLYEHSDKLYAIHGEQESRITNAYDHRTSIESKVEKNIAAFPDIHTKLSDLGTSVSDVSSALGIHKAEFDIHKTHDLIPNPFGELEKYLPYVLIGGVALLAMRKR